MQKLFSHSFGNTDDPEIDPIVSHLPETDAKIQAAAPEWPLNKISKIDLAVLRLAVHEITVSRDQPVKVVIDEAVELGKEFGNVASPSFVNGVLGTIVSADQPKEKS